MPGDPFAIFREGGSRRETLKVIWPELYECLAGIGAFAKPRNLYCVIGECSKAAKARAGVPAAGRLTVNGHPACKHHLHALADIPGGWPLRRLDSDEAEHHRREAERGR